MVSLLRPGLSCPAAAPTPAAGTPQNYEEALRIAETREREVRGYFDKYDLDGSGTTARSKCRLGSDRARLLRLLRARLATPGSSRHPGEGPGLWAPSLRCSRQPPPKPPILTAF